MIIESGNTYIIKEEIDGRYKVKSITCLKCNRTSYNINDIENKYCGNCHEFHQANEVLL
jgi:hypothetical protein